MAKTIFDASKIDESLREVLSDDVPAAPPMPVDDPLTPNPFDDVVSSEPKLPSRDPRDTDENDFGTTNSKNIFETRSESPQHSSLDGNERPKKRRRRPSDYSRVLSEEPSSEGWFGSYVSQPSHMHFETQHESEEILLVLRQHPIVLVPKLFTLLGLALLPLLVFPLFPFFILIPPHLSFFSFIGWYVFTTIYAIESFLDWYYNIYIITDERIIDIDFFSLIYKSVAEAKLNKIEDVTATTAGVMGATLNYGTITIQTAAEKREFEFAKVPRPATVTKLLNELMLEEEREAIEGRVM